MSRSRRDLHKAKQRHDRIRREKHAQRAEARPEPGIGDFPRVPPPTIGGFPKLPPPPDPLENDPRWEAQKWADRVEEADDFEQALDFIRTALEINPDCTDAQRHKVTLLPLGRANGVRLMRGIVERAEGLLGERFFDEHKGYIGKYVDGLSYLRAKQYLGELLVEAGLLEEAIAVCRRIHELDSGYNHGMRLQLLALYLASNRLEDTERLFASYAAEQAFRLQFAWARIQLHWLAGDLAGAAAAVERTRPANPFVEDYITGALEFSDEAPVAYHPGEESEAEFCAAHLGIAWKMHPGFGEWLRSLG